MTKMLQCHDKTLIDEELPLTGWEKKVWFLDTESTGEDTLKTVKMTTKDLGYIKLVDSSS